MTPTRRSFLHSLAIAAPATSIAAAPTRDRAPRDLETDVLVIGGGPAGTIAAIQAARLGSRTTLVEAGPQLGGTTTTGGVNYPGLFHAWGKQVIAGIGWELVHRAVQLLGDPLPDFSKIPPRHSMHQVRVNAAVYAAIVEEACLQAGVSLRLYESPLAAERADGVWSLDLAGKGARVRIRARQLVDCTGNASIVGLLGLARLREAETQPGTLMFHLEGYDLRSLDLQALERDRELALRDGRLHKGDLLGSVESFLRGGGSNAMHLPGADSCSSESHTLTNTRGRAALLRILRFLKSHPGFERLRPERVALEVGVRETYRIVGDTLVTVADYTSGKVFPDAVAHAFYPVDLHVESGVTPEPLRRGVVPTIPLGALIPRASSDLLVAGRSLSSDRLANSALRVQASCMAMGQAAGAAASLASTTGATPREVPLAKLRATLVAHGAIVPNPAS